MKKRNTVFSRVVLLFLALMILWTVASFGLLRFTSAKLTGSTLETILQGRDYTLSGFESIFTDTLKSASAGGALEYSQALCLLSEYSTQWEKIQLVRQIQESLTLTKTLGRFIENACIYAQPLSTVYNSAGSSKGSAYSLQPGEYERAVTLLERAKDGIPFVVDEGRVKLVLSNASDCILDVEFSSSDITQHLLRSISYPESASCALIFGDLTVGNLSDENMIRSALTASRNQELIPFRYEREDYYLYCFQSRFVGFTYLELIPKSIILQPVRLSLFLTVGLAVISVIMILLFLVQAYRLIHKPLRELMESFEALRTGDFSIRAQLPETNDFAYLYDSFNYTVGELQKLVAQNYQQKILLQKAELRQLQAQISPHFLYNSFFLLQRVIDSGDAEQASLISHDLGLYFRFVTKQNTDFIPLRDEDQHARIYTHIQSIRFSGRIRMEFDPLPDRYAELSVPKLFLQPLIENAYRYGLETKEADGRLRIRYQAESPDSLKITIEDNGDHMTDEQLLQLSERIAAAMESPDVDNFSGMMNIARRMYNLYQRKDTFAIDRSELGGMRITVRVLTTPQMEEYHAANYCSG